MSHLSSRLRMQEKGKMAIKTRLVTTNLADRAVSQRPLNIAPVVDRKTLEQVIFVRGESQT